MPSVRLYPENIKIYMNELYNYIYNSDYEEARRVAKILLREIVKYNETRGYECNFYELFHELDFALRNCSDGEEKRRYLSDLLGKIARIIENPTGNPLHILEDLYHELLRYPIGEQNIKHIMNTLTEILEIEPLIEKLDIIRRNYYSILKQEIAKYHAYLTEVALTKAPSRETSNQIVQQLSNVLTAMQKVISPLVRVEIPKEQLLRLIKSEVPPSEIAKVTGYDEDELRMMLAQIKEEGEKSETD